MMSYPTPRARGRIKPPRPIISPPSVGHHIHWIGSLCKASFAV
jgi:hypothetical protein